MSTLNSFPAPLDLKVPIKTKMCGFIRVVHKSQWVNKKGFTIPMVRFWRSIVFNKASMCCLCVCRDRRDSGRDRLRRKDWRWLIEMHLESKLIFSAGQRTGYGNKKRDVIRFRGI